MSYKPLIYSTSWSSSFEAGRYRAYYGVDEKDERSGEWCFVLFKNEKELVRYTNSELLESACGEAPKDLLIAGLALYFSGK